jgi:diguanylate cyclase (GGDEF)-like protein
MLQFKKTKKGMSVRSNSLYKTNNTQSDRVGGARKIMTMRIMSYLVSAIMIVFAVLYLDEKPSPLKYTVLIIGALAIANSFLSTYIFNVNINIAATFILFTTLSYGMVLTGGYGETGLFWAYLLLPILFVLFGAKTGLLASVMSFLGFIMVLNVPYFNVTHYDSPHISRFLITYFLLFAFLYIKEYFAEYGFKSLTRLSDRNHRQANLDPLTSLPNRRFLDSIYFEEARRDPMSFLPMTVAVIDVDRFKLVNDSLGHDVGDQVLVHIAEVLKSNLRGDDIVARTGGEEFLVLLPQTSSEAGFEVLDKLRRKLYGSVMVDERIQSVLPTPLSFSAGVSNVVSMDIMHLAMKAADKAMYRAKKEGRNNVIMAAESGSATL